ncbi:MAG: hypothetical protein WC712_07975 [Candidatus Brocadiia bacterium]
MRIPSLAFVLFLSASALALCEDAGPSNSPYYSREGNAALVLLDKAIQFPRPALSAPELVQVLSWNPGLRLRHSSCAAALLTPAQMPMAGIGNARAALDTLVPLGVKWIVDFDGTILLYTADDPVLTPDAKEDFGDTPPAQGNWRTELAWARKGRISLAAEELGKTIDDFGWRFKYAPLLCPDFPAASLKVTREYLHEPLGQVLDDIVRCNAGAALRVIPWCGTLLIQRATGGGREPEPVDASVWMGAGSGAQRIGEWLKDTVETRVGRPGPCAPYFLETAISASGRVVYYDGKPPVSFTGVPTGRIGIGTLLGLVRDMDGLKCAVGDRWVLLFAGDAPGEMLSRLKEAEMKFINVGIPLKTGEMLESFSIEELDEKTATKVREMSVGERLDRPLRVALRREPLRRALARIEMKAFFHVVGDPRVAEKLDFCVLEGYFDSVAVRTILDVICESATLSWSIDGKAPPPETRDTRFVIRVGFPSDN